MGNLIIRNGGSLTIQGDSLSIIDTSLTSGQVYTEGAASYGFTDFSEFSVGASIPTGISRLFDVTPPTAGIGTDGVEGNYFYVNNDDIGTKAMTIDSFDGTLTNNQTDELEMLGRVYVPTDPAAARNIGGPGAFITGVDGTVSTGFYSLSSDVYLRPGDYESVLVQTIESNGQNRAGWADIQEPEQDEVWMWQRWRVLVNGANDNYYVKSWYGSLQNEPVNWDVTTIPGTKRSTQLGLKIGWVLRAASIIDEVRISFLSFSTDPNTTSPPTP